MKVKICGIFEEQTLIELKENKNWPDYIGFVFAKSRRQVTTSQVNSWIPHIPFNVRTVGVFVNPTIQEVEEAPVEIIQLHGEETPQFCQQIKQITRKTIWKVISVKTEPTNQEVKRIQKIYESYEKMVDGFVFDTASAQRGGTGVQFEWNSVKGIWSQSTKPILLAGGIRKEDLPVLRHLSVAGIDLSSGVEINGRKSVEKILELLVEARRDESI